MYDFLDDLNETFLKHAAEACEGLQPNDDYVTGQVDLLLSETEDSQRYRDLLADWLVGNRNPVAFIVEAEELVLTEYRVECYSARQAAAAVRLGQAERTNTTYTGRFLDRVQPREAEVTDGESKPEEEAGQA